MDAADTLVEEFDLIEFLEAMTVRVATVSENSAVGLLLADPRGRLQFMAATQESARLLELFVVQNNDGPCRECFAAGEVVVEADLRLAHDRWPTFAPRAMAARFRSVCAVPMRHHGRTIGALSLFGTADEVLSAQDLLTVQGFADITTIGILQDRAARRKDLFAQQLQSVLASRAAIEQAKCALAQRGQTDIDTAAVRTFGGLNEPRPRKSPTPTWASTANTWLRLIVALVGQRVHLLGGGIWVEAQT